MTIQIGEEAKGLLKIILMVNRGIETHSFRAKIGRIGSGDIKTVKVEDITIEIMTIKASMDVVGEVITIITEDSKATTMVEAVGGIHHRIMIRKDIHTTHIVIINSTLNHPCNTTINNPCLHNHMGSKHVPVVS